MNCCRFEKESVKLLRKLKFYGLILVIYEVKVEWGIEVIIFLFFYIGKFF